VLHINYLQIYPTKDGGFPFLPTVKSAMLHHAKPLHVPSSRYYFRIAANELKQVHMKAFAITGALVVLATYADARENATSAFEVFAITDCELCTLDEDSVYCSEGTGFIENSTMMTYVNYAQNGDPAPGEFCWEGELLRETDYHAQVTAKHIECCIIHGGTRLADKALFSCEGSDVPTTNAR